MIKSLTRGSMDMSDMRIQDWSLTLGDGRDTISGLRFRGSELSNVSLAGLIIENADFSQSTLDAVDFTGTKLKNVVFSQAWLVDAIFVGTEFDKTDFRGLDNESILVARVGANLERVAGNEALGFLRFHGAITDDIDDYYVQRNHPNFEIVDKIIERLVMQAKSQYRGLTQRGEAHADPKFARDFVNFLEREKIVTIDSRRLVGATPYGRKVLAGFRERKMPDAFSRFLSRP